MTVILDCMRDSLARVRNTLLYNGRYFGMIDDAACRSAVGMAKSCYEAFRPRCVIDYGCGTGAFLAAMKSHGCFVAGTEVSPPARRLCDSKMIPTIPLNLTAPPWDPPFGPADLATSFEVAEHLPETAAEKLVQLLVRSAPIVVFSAATPGQGGQGHINEQPFDYWIRRFDSAGLPYSDSMTSRFRSEWCTGGVEWWYAKNVLIFGPPSAKSVV